MNQDQKRVDELQKEMDIMKQRYEQFMGPYNPNFDPNEFRKAIQFYFLLIFIPLFVLTELSIMNGKWLDEVVQNAAIGGVSLFSLPGIGESLQGLLPSEGYPLESSLSEVSR